MVHTKVAEYRTHAQECLRLADLLTSAEHRTVLVTMARAWHQLAQFHENADQLATIGADR